MFCRALLMVPLVACATARQEHTAGDDDAGGDMIDAAMPGGMGDAAKMADAPPSSACANPVTGMLATYAFASETGNQVSTPASIAVAGIAATPISRASGLTAVSGAGSINASNWATTATRDLTKYFTLTLTPASGCKLALTSAAIDARASGTGPTMAAISTSADSFAATVSISTAAASSPAFSVSGVTSALEVRVYGFAATSTGGTMRIQGTLTLSGSLQ